MDAILHFLLLARYVTVQTMHMQMALRYATIRYGSLRFAGGGWAALCWAELWWRLCMLSDAPPCSAPGRTGGRACHLMPQYSTVRVFGVGWEWEWVWVWVTGRVGVGVGVMVTLFFRLSAFAARSGPPSRGISG